MSDTDYGYDQIEILCNHYKLDLMSCKQEWMGFKEVIRSASTLNMLKYRERVTFCPLSLAYPLLSNLAGFALSLQVSMMQNVKRGFSAMKSTKTTLRNHLAIN